MSTKIEKLLGSEDYINSKYNLKDDKGNRCRIEQNFSEKKFSIYRYNNKKNNETLVGYLDYVTHNIDKNLVFEIILIKSDQNGDGIRNLLINKFIKFTENEPIFLLTNNESTKNIADINGFAEIINNTLVYGDINSMIIDKIRYS